MNRNYIYHKVLDVYKECEIYSFPFDHFKIIEAYQLRLFPYSTLDDTLYAYCTMFSDDALTFKDKVCYNDRLPAGRIYFSLMHELGHHILNHSLNRTPKMEQEANIFASNILAPRMAVHYARCKSAADVANIFKVTNECAGYVFEDYLRWHDSVTNHKMSEIDKRMYQHFYNDHLKRFVYRLEECIWCHRLVYNSTSSECPVCKAKHKKTKDFFTIEEDQSLNSLHTHWLYNGV